MEKGIGIILSGMIDWGASAATVRIETITGDLDGSIGTDIMDRGLKIVFINVHRGTHFFTSRSRRTLSVGPTVTTVGFSASGFAPRLDVNIITAALAHAEPRRSWV
jgi:hypothetical protein